MELLRDGFFNRLPFRDYKVCIDLETLIMEMKMNVKFLNMSSPSEAVRGAILSRYGL